MTATVVVNLLWLVPGQVGGSEESTVATLRGLAELAPTDLQLRLLVLEPFAGAHPDIVAAFPHDVLRLSGRSRGARVLAETSWLGRRTSDATLAHHAGGTAPMTGDTPYVLTLHDLQPLLPPTSTAAAERTHSRLKRAYLRAVVPRSLRRARRVVVPSEFVRTGVIQQAGLDPSTVVVVPHGVERGSPGTPAGTLVDRYGLDGPVVLYPAITYPHKDHATLVEAFAAVLVDHPSAVLVLPGRPDRAEAALTAQVDRLGIAPRVRRLGRVPTEDLAGLYDLATVVAVPSVYEGFGLPAAEAMAHGVPVVAADATALPEVVGDAGVLVAPGDGPAWADALSELLDDPVRRRRLAADGTARSVRFGRAANAAAMADVYRSAID